MTIAVIGVSHHTAPVEVREKFAFPRPEAVRALRTLREEAGVREAVLLSTCNRTELYVHPGRTEAVEAARRLLMRQAGGEEGEGWSGPPESYLYHRRDEEAVSHLFRVTAGVDSMVLGEAEIQGQVREAHVLASEVPAEPSLVGPVMHRLFERSLSVGGRIRSETRLGEGSASVASVAVDLARKVFGSLKNRRVLVLGAGSTAELVVEALARDGVRGVVVANRTYERARDLADRLQGEAVRFEEMARALGESDIVVASTAAPHPLITGETIRTAFPEGPRQPFLAIDIAIPRDVDPEVGEESNVFLYNVDDLRQIVDENLERRRQAVPRAERIVGEETQEFRAWLASREVVPMLRRLRRRGHELRREELERTLSGLSHLSEEDRARVEELSRRLVNKLLHEPTVRLKEGAADGRGPDLIEAMQYLYDLESRGEGRADDEQQ